MESVIRVFLDSECIHPIYKFKLLGTCRKFWALHYTVDLPGEYLFELVKSAPRDYKFSCVRLTTTDNLTHEHDNVTHLHFLVYGIRFYPYGQIKKIRYITNKL